MTSNNNPRKYSEAFLNSIIENIPNMIFIKDAQELRFTHINKAGEDLLGYSKEDLIGKNDYDFFPKEQADFFTSNDRAVISSGEMVDILEEKITTKNLGERILHTKKIVLVNDEGNPTHLLGISEDITDRKRVEDELLEQMNQVGNLNNLMMNREIKMAELKKQVEELTSKIQSKN